MSSRRLLHYDRIEAAEPDGSDAYPVDKEALPDSRPWLYLLHGIFGAGRNWRSIASRVVRARPPWGAMLVDLRMHGESQGFEPPHTLDACAADLEALADDTGLFPAAVLGHSFGGKVALSYLARAATGDEAPRQVWVMDSTPSAREAVGDAKRMLGAVRSFPARFFSRAAAVDDLKQAGFPDRVASWMSANLARSEEGYVWKLDFDALELLLHDFFRLDMWPIVEDPPPGSELHFVKATRSLVMTEGEAERIRAIGRDRPVHLHEVEGGHWLNADNPDAVLALLERGGEPVRVPVSPRRRRLHNRRIGSPPRRRGWIDPS
jgi:pimeloyl-ACP methyl ester carboxylesterase